MKFTVKNCRLTLRPITLEDAHLIVKWRNKPDARKVFYTKVVVTEDTHRHFLENRKDHDFIWIIENECNEPIGVTSLTIHPELFIGEYGRTYIDKNYRGRHYLSELDYLMCFISFEIFYLNELYLSTNSWNVIVKIHENHKFKVVNDFPNIFHNLPEDTVVMKIDRNTWKEERINFTKKFNVDLPEWEE